MVKYDIAVAFCECNILLCDIILKSYHNSREHRMKEKIDIFETIIVEGKDDVSAVKNAVNANVITTSGLGINKKIEELIKISAQKTGIIILTDSDFAGEKIRKKVEKIAKNENVKHAFIPREDSTKGDDVGVENAGKEAIILALKMAKPKKAAKKEFTNMDMIKYNLTGNQNSSYIRNEVGKKLGIGYANGKQFLNRLNAFGISRVQLEEIIKEMDKL